MLDALGSAGTQAAGLWEFNADGLMQRRIASINDLAITEAERKFPHPNLEWPLGRRPDGQPGLTELGL